ncbi:hypothetical protein [Fredinandcohnia sp. 179-A 10B2 NHS]|uniref:hypothetical protein n=1 Tax=Fredinandcohnia sp. 179-A 10B2 NHS TaxID=3235176 RepID=UPI0039A0CC71
MSKLLLSKIFLLSFLMGQFDKPLHVHMSEYQLNSYTVLAKQDFQVIHKVKNNNVYIECFISDFTFTNKEGMKKAGEGHLQVIINGNKTENFSTAAFVVKGLSKGEHTLTLRVVHNDLTYYPLSKTINVVIK